MDEVLDPGDPLVLPRQARRSSPQGLTWWSRAFVRSFEELAYARSDLVEARALARSGRLGAIVVLRGLASAAVDPGDPGSRLAQVKVGLLADEAWSDFAAAAASETGHLAALEAGTLPGALAAAAEEAGVELVPGPEEIEAACECDAWTQPCTHALGLLYQLAWRLDLDPHVLFLLRGRSRADFFDLLSRAPLPRAGSPEIDDAAARAQGILDLDPPLGHGWSDSTVAAYDEAVAGLVDPE